MLGPAVNRIECSTSGVQVLEPVVHGDERGFFLEFYNARTFAALGIDRRFVQDNHSRSRRGVLRGLHYQLEHPQAKLVRVVSGEVWDVAVDIRRGSPTFGTWVAHVLSAANKRMMFVPEGFAHGFYVLSDAAEINYKCSDYYAPADERGLAWNDPTLAIEWPLQGEPLLSERDRRFPRLADQPSLELPALAREPAG
jgi:dTDP-4-dehydrorhamnose 3,5-epimerase